MITPDTIIAIIAREFRLTRRQLLRRTRVQHIVWPRHLCIHLLVTRCPHLGISGVARKLQCDRGTIRNACRDVADRTTIYPEYAAQLKHLETLIPPIPAPAIAIVAPASRRCRCPVRASTPVRVSTLAVNPVNPVNPVLPSPYSPVRA